MDLRNSRYALQQSMVTEGMQKSSCSERKRVRVVHCFSLLSARKRELASEHQKKTDEKCEKLDAPNE